MHEVDETTEQMVRSVLAYAENRLRMNPVPLDKGVLSADELHERLDGLIREGPRQPDEVLGLRSFIRTPAWNSCARSWPGPSEVRCYPPWRT
jgi:hypothetical protein